MEEFRSSLGKLKESLRTSNKTKNKSDQKQQQNGTANKKRDWEMKKDKKTTQTSEAPAIKSGAEYTEQLGK
jgi:hypothetical protein